MGFNTLRSIVYHLVDPFNTEHLTGVQSSYFSHRISKTMAIHARKTLLFYGSWHAHAAKGEVMQAHMRVPLEKF